MSILQTEARIDFAATALSTLCLVHCLVLPVTLALLPLSLGWLEDEWIHRVLVLVAVPVSGLAIFASLKGNEGPLFPLAALTGLTLLASAAFAESFHEYEVPVTVAGALTLAAAHIVRWTMRHRHNHDNTEGPG